MMPKLTLAELLRRPPTKATIAAIVRLKAFLDKQARGAGIVLDVVREEHARRSERTNRSRATRTKPRARS